MFSVVVVVVLSLSLFFFSFSFFSLLLLLLLFSVSLTAELGHADPMLTGPVNYNRGQRGTS